VSEKVVGWFDSELKEPRAPESRAPLSLGLNSQGPVPALAARALAEVARQVLADTLAYGQLAAQPGLHIMAMPTPHFVEAITGLGGSGVDIILVLADGAAPQGHPMIPTLEVTTGESSFEADFDLVLLPGQKLSEATADLLELLRDTWQGTYLPRAVARGSHDFQVTRGHLGVSL
jgi:altronate dehydratase